MATNSFKVIVDVGFRKYFKLPNNNQYAQAHFVAALKVDPKAMEA